MSVSSKQSSCLARSFDYGVFMGFMLKVDNALLSNEVLQQYFLPVVDKPSISNLQHQTQMY